MGTDSLDGSSIDEDLLVSYYPPVYSTEDDYMELIASLPEPPDAEYFLSGGLGEFVADPSGQPEAVLLETEEDMAEHFWSGQPSSQEAGTVGCWQVNRTNAAPTPVIERELPILTADECAQYRPQVNTACLEELKE